MDGGAYWVTAHWVAKESDTTAVILEPKKTKSDTEALNKC